jgi:putative component of membrane protein insertase Oxa1/YidC/SpoIIIJ protein YidD
MFPGRGLERQYLQGFTVYLITLLIRILRSRPFLSGGIFMAPGRLEHGFQKRYVTPCVAGTPRI